MEIGDLWTGVQWGLTRPGTRIPTFGKLATSSQERKSFKKIAQEEAQVIRMAKRFDVGEELNDYIHTKQSQVWREHPVKLALHANNLRTPFPAMWFEFKSQDIPNTLVACLVEQAPIQGYPGIHDIAFHFYMADLNDTVATICEHAVILTQEGGPSQWLKHIPDPDERVQFMQVISRVAYGIEDLLDWNDTLIIDPYIDVLQRTQLMHKMMVGTYRLEGVEDWNHATGHLRHLRFVITLINLLNYPWVKKEVVTARPQQRSKSPQVTPSDSYYRCKINLPKPEGVVSRGNEPRTDSYGKRLHQVRGHWRVFRNDEGEFVNRTWIKAHQRGNAKLGVVHKDYQLDFAPKP